LKSASGSCQVDENHDRNGPVCVTTLVMTRPGQFYSKNNHAFFLVLLSGCLLPACGSNGSSSAGVGGNGTTGGHGTLGGTNALGGSSATASTQVGTAIGSGGTANTGTGGTANTGNGSAAGGAATSTGGTVGTVGSATGGVTHAGGVSGAGGTAGSVGSATGGAVNTGGSGTSNKSGLGGSSGAGTVATGGVTGTGGSGGATSGGGASGTGGSKTGGAGGVGVGGTTSGGTASSGGMSSTGGSTSNTYTCNTVLGIDSTSEWYTNGFENQVPDARWQLIYNHPGYVEDWESASDAVYSKAPTSPCSADSGNPDRVILNVFADPSGSLTTSAALVTGLSKAVDTIKSKYSRLKRLDLLTMSRGPSNQECFSSSNTVVAAYVDDAISKVVTAYPGLVTASPKFYVTDCSDFDSTNPPHLSATGKTNMAKVYGDYYTANP